MIPKVFKKIDPSDVSLIPLRVYRPVTKQYADLNNDAYKLRYAKYSKKHIPIGTDNDTPHQANNGHLLINADETYYDTVWRSIHQLYYNVPYGSMTKEHPTEKTHKKLPHWFISLTLPYHDVGESIKPGSVEISINSLSDNHVLKDDENGNLLWYNKDTLSYVHTPTIIDFVKNYEPIFEFNISELYKEPTYTSVTSLSGVNPKSLTITGIEVSNRNYVGTNLSYFYNTYPYTKMYYDSSIRIKDSDKFKTDEEFLISYSVVFNTRVDSFDILSKKRVRVQKKQGLKTTDNKVRKVIYEEDEIVNSIKFPYHLMYKTGNVLEFTRSDGINTITIQTSGILTNRYYQIIISRYFHQTDNVYKIYYYVYDTVNNVTIDEQIVVDVPGSTENDYDITIGQFNDSTANQFWITDLRMYQNTFLNDSNDSNCADIFSSMPDYNFQQNPFNIYYGNVFYRNGQIVIPGLFNINVITSVSFESTHTIYEYETLCRVNKGEFNITLNPSARKHFRSADLNSDFSNTDIRPYITNIGLYNSAGELLVTAKLAQPVQMRDDVDLNFLIKWEG